jgi:hypothetical protein
MAVSSIQIQFNIVSVAKALLQTLKDIKFDLFIAHVQFVCTQYEIDITHINASYKKATCRSCQQQGSVPTLSL